MTLAVLATPAEDAAFDAHLEAAQTAFREERFGEAADALEAAYGLSPQDDVLFNWANAERLSGDCTRAIELYDRYLGAVAEDVAAGDDVSKGYAAVAEERKAECIERAPEPDPKPEPEPEPEPKLVPRPAEADLRDPELGRAEPTDAAPARDWTKDALGWSLVGVGTAAAATGGALLGSAFVGTPEPADRDTHDAYLSDVRRGSRLEIAGWSMVGVGSALIVGGIVRLAVLARTQRGRERASLVVRF